MDKENVNPEVIIGKIRCIDHRITNFKLMPGVILTVISPFFEKEFDADDITHSDQVIRLIDEAVTTVKEWQVGEGQWRLYR